jgi:threonine/homoserine/homoserine lactone efflux protein
MNFEQGLALLGFSIVVAGTPGPSNALLTATGANVGVMRGLPALIGVVAGMSVLMFVVAFGLGSVVLQQPLILTVVKWSGAAFLLWLAWKIATSHTAAIGGDVRPVGFVGAAAFQWINPKSWLACTSAAAAFFDPGGGSAQLQALLMALIFASAALPSCFVWLAFGAVVQRTLRSERAMRTFNIAMALLLAASVVFFVT